MAENLVSSPEGAPREENTEVGKKEAEKSASSKGFPCLEIVKGPDAGTRIVLKAGLQTVGRAQENDIILEDSSISRRHAQITVADEMVTIDDAGSRNGVRVNGVKIKTATALVHGTRVKMGLYECRFLSSEAPAPEPVMEPKTQVPPEKPEEAGGGPIGMDEVPDSEATPVEAFVPAKKSYARWGLSLCIVLAVFATAYFLGQRFLKISSDAETPIQVREGLESVAESVAPGTVEVPVELSRVPIVLDITSLPISADIYYGDRLMGQTPFRTPMTLEKNKIYEVRAVFNLPEVDERVESKAQFSPPGEGQLVSIPFVGRLGVLTVEYLPRDATLYLEASFEQDPFKAKPIKLTDFVFNKPMYLPYGKYIVEVRQNRQGDDSLTFLNEVIYQREFVIDESHKDYTINLNEKDLANFPVLIRSTPLGADVYFDELKVGQTPYEGSLPLGEHVLQLKKEGFFDHIQVIKMLMNAPSEVDIPLKTSAAGEMINLAKKKIREGRYAEAQGALTDGLKKSQGANETAEINYLFGVTLLRLGHVDDALVYFERSEKNDFFRESSRLGKAHVAFAKGDKVGALKLFIEIFMATKDPAIKSDAGQLFQEITPLKSVLYIVSDPPGAEVYVNSNKMRQNTPVILHELGIGPYRIVVRRQGYQTEEFKLDLGVSEFKPVIVKLKPVEE